MNFRRISGAPYYKIQCSHFQQQKQNFFSLQGTAMFGRKIKNKELWAMPNISYMLF